MEWARYRRILWAAAAAVGVLIAVVLGRGLTVATYKAPTAEAPASAFDPAPNITTTARAAATKNLRME